MGRRNIKNRKSKALAKASMESGSLATLAPGSAPNPARATEVDKQLKPATADSGNVHYDPATEEVTIGKGEDAVVLKPESPIKTESVVNLVQELAKLKIIDAKPGVNHEMEMMKQLLADDTADGICIEKSYVGILSTITRQTKEDGTNFYRTSLTRLAETDLASDIRFTLYSGGVEVDRRDYKWDVVVNGTIVTSGGPGIFSLLPWPKALPFKMMLGAPVTISLTLEGDHYVKSFGSLSWKVDWCGFCINRNKAKFAITSDTWCYMELEAEATNELRTMEIRAGMFHPMLGSWESISKTREEKVEAQKAQQEKERQEELQQKNANASGTANASAQATGAKTKSAAEKELEAMCAQ